MQLQTQNVLILIKHKSEVNRMRIDRIKLATLLIEKDMTALQLSAMSGISRVTISSIKRGKSCSGDTAIKIAKALDVKLTDLIRGD